MTLRTKPKGPVHGRRKAVGIPEDTHSRLLAFCHDNKFYIQDVVTVAIEEFIRKGAPDGKAQPKHS